MTKSFKKSATDAPGNLAAPEDNQTPAVQSERQLALPTDDMAGSWGIKDIRLPQLNLVHKTSKTEIVKAFGIGSFILAKLVKLSDGETPVFVTAIRAARDLQQKLPYGADERPKVYKDENEVLANGGSLDYDDADSGNFYQPRAHLQLVIPMPDGTNEEGEAFFPYEFEGTSYALALYTVSSSAFTSVGKEIATLKANNKVMRKGLRYGKLALTSESRKNAKNEWAVPVIKYAGENPEGLVKFYESLLSQ